MRRRRLIAVLAGSALLCGALTTVNPAAADTTVAVVAGTGTADPLANGVQATTANLSNPSDVAVDANGNVQIADTYHHEARLVNTIGVITDYVGAANGSGGYAEDGSALNQPRGVASDGAGGWFVSNTLASMVLHKSASGTVTRVAGRYAPYGGPPYSVDITPGQSATDAFLNQPAGLAYDTTTDMLYITDQYSSRILKVHVSTNQIWVVAGVSATNSNGYNGDEQAATSAQLNYPQDAVVRAGQIYIADTSNNRVRRVDTNGVIHTLSTFETPAGLGVAPNGQLYGVAGNSGIVYQIADNGTLTQYANLGACSTGLDATASGVYVAATCANKVFKITSLIPPPISVVSLGDSVASGEGLNYDWRWNGQNWVRFGSTNPVWAGDSSAANQACHRSLQAYPYLVTQAEGNNLTHLACTGATANAGILNYQTMAGGVIENPQMGYHGSGYGPPSSTYDLAHASVVLLTVGADDVQFAAFMKECYSPVAACNTTKNTQKLNGLLASQRQNLHTVLSEINYRATQAGTHVKVAVTTYYNPFPASGTCLDISGYGGAWGLNPSERSWVVSGLNQLNSNIRTEATWASSNLSGLDVRLVELAQTSATTDVLAGHQLCSSDPWVYGPSIVLPTMFHGSGSSLDDPTPLHPTPAGHTAIASRVEASLG